MYADVLSESKKKTDVRLMICLGARLMRLRLCPYAEYCGPNEDVPCYNSHVSQSILSRYSEDRGHCHQSDEAVITIMRSRNMFFKSEC